MPLAFWLARRCGARTTRNGRRIKCHLPRGHAEADHEGWTGFSVMVRWRGPS